MSEELYEGEDIYTLTDEDGEEKEFGFLGSCEVDGKEYLALVPMGEGEGEEYVILRREMDENGDEMLVTIDDDDEFDRIADIFEDELFDEIDYDGDGNN